MIFHGISWYIHSLFFCLLVFHGPHFIERLASVSTPRLLAQPEQLRTAIEMLAFMHVSLGQVELPGMDWIMMDPRISYGSTCRYIHVYIYIWRIQKGGVPLLKRYIGLVSSVV